MAIRRFCCRKQGQWSHNKEMCHEEIHRCSRVDLTYCDPDAHPDCKRSPRVAVELLIREQRLLTTSRARERLCLRLKLHGGRLALARRLPPTARSISPVNRFASLRCLTHERTDKRKTGQSKATQIKGRSPRMIRFNGVEGRRKMRNNDHETRFCGSIGSGGLRRRSYSRLCPRRWWAWRRVCEPWRLRAQSYHSLGITSTADARFPKSDSGPTRGTFAGAGHQRAVGAKPLWGGYVGASALLVEPPC